MVADGCRWLGEIGRWEIEKWPQDDQFGKQQRRGGLLSKEILAKTLKTRVIYFHGKDWTEKNHMCNGDATDSNTNTTDPKSPFVLRALISRFWVEVVKRYWITKFLANAFNFHWREESHALDDTSPLTSCYLMCTAVKNLYWSGNQVFCSVTFWPWYIHLFILKSDYVLYYHDTQVFNTWFVWPHFP